MQEVTNTSIAEPRKSRAPVPAWSPLTTVTEIYYHKKKDVISLHILGKSSLFHQMVMTLVMSGLYQRPTHSSKGYSQSKHPSLISQTLGQIHKPKLESFEALYIE